MLQVVAYGFCTVCAIGATYGFAAATMQVTRVLVRKLQIHMRTPSAAMVAACAPIAQYVPNAPLPAHNAR